MSRISQSAPAFQHERKFVLQRDEAERFMALVAPRLALEVYDEGLPVAYTRTTYLDTADLELYRSCTGGPVARRLRVREYAGAVEELEAPVLTGVAVLELKESSGQMRTKARLQAPPHIIDHVVRHAGAPPPGSESAFAGLQAFAAIRQALAAGTMVPKLTTWYRRVALAGDGGRVRVTLDEGTTFCLPTTVGQSGEPATPPAAIGHGPSRIMEVKYFGDAPEWLAAAMRGLTEAIQFSKFRRGMECLERAAAAGGAVRSTRPITVPAGGRVKVE